MPRETLETKSKRYHRHHTGQVKDAKESLLTTNRTLNRDSLGLGLGISTGPHPARPEEKGDFILSWLQQTQTRRDIPPESGHRKENGRLGENYHGNVQQDKRRKRPRSLSDEWSPEPAKPAKDNRTFEKRARHKTREDKYEYKARKLTRRSKTDGQGKGETRRSNRLQTHKTREPVPQKVQKQRNPIPETRVAAGQVIEASERALSRQRLSRREKEDKELEELSAFFSRARRNHFESRERHDPTQGYFRREHHLASESQADTSHYWHHSRDSPFRAVAQYSESLSVARSRQTPFSSGPVGSEPAHVSPSRSRSGEEQSWHSPQPIQKPEVPVLERRRTVSPEKVRHPVMENSKRDAAAQADLSSPADAELLKPSQNQGHARPEGNEASGIPPQQDHVHPPQTGTPSQFPLTVNTEAQTQLATEMTQVPLSRPVMSVNGQTLSQSAQWPAYNGGLNQLLPGMEADERINAICQHTQHSGEGGMGLPSQVQWVVPPQVRSHEYHDLNVSAYDVGYLEQPRLESMEEFIRRIEAEAMLAGTETGMTEKPLDVGTRLGMLGAGELEQDETTFREFYPFSEMPRAGITTRSAQNLDVDLLPPPRLTSVGDPIQQRSWDLGLSPRDSPRGQGRYEFDRRIGGRAGLWEL